MIPMNWYLELELHHGTTKWDILRESFILNFGFEDGFEGIDEALQEIKASIFRTPKKPVELAQLDWSLQLRHALECYNVIVEEEEEDPRNIAILETEGKREVKGSKVANPDISEPLKTQQVNIRSEAKPNFKKICDYWDEDTVDKVAELRREYWDLFPTKFSDLKGIIEDLGVMKITLKLDAKPIKQRPYQLNP